jgi:crotonobetainyl-CoA:carnitine CoA-transferase CaiB-like acyl-CoA transferase
MYPLQGLKVLDFSHAADGPTCGLMLAQAGADVIKIESPRGDPFRYGPAALSFYNTNRNKRSLALNLQAPEGREIAHKLAATSDILLESFTPGVADRLGIGYSEIEKINPRIIYCSVSGFGQTGPYKQKPAYDPVIHAMSGLMSITGEADGPPVRIPSNVVGLPTAFLAAYNVLLAVIAREKSGKGQRIDASFFDTAVYFMSALIAGYAMTGYVMPRMGSANPAFAPYQCFLTADRYVFIGVTTDNFWQSFCKALHLDELGSNPDYTSAEGRLAHRDEMISQISAALRKLPSGEIIRKLDAAEVPCAPVQEIPEVLNDPQVKARQIFFDMDYPDAGKIKLANLPAWPSDIQRLESVRAPRLGEHTVEILLGLGYDSAGIDALERKGVILKN